MVSTRPLIFNSPGPITNSLRIVPKAPITLGITVIFISHSIFSYLAWLSYLSLFAFFQFSEVLQSLYQSCGDCTKNTNYNWYNRHFYVPPFFNSLARSKYLSFFSLSFNFSMWSVGTEIQQLLFFLLIIIRCGRLPEIRWPVCMSKY